MFELHKAKVNLYAADEEVRSYFASSSRAQDNSAFSSPSPASSSSSTSSSNASSNATTPSPFSAIDLSRIQFNSGKKYTQTSLNEAFQFGKKLKHSRSCSSIADIKDEKPKVKSLSKRKCVEESASAKAPISQYSGRLPLVRSNALSGNQFPLGVNVISIKTAAELINGLSGYHKYYDEIHVLDCRFEFEYQGGHIDGAIHVQSPYELQAKYFEAPENGSKICILFHCEYSQERGPSMWRLMRELDRKLKGYENFPSLFYPEMYIIEGGYKQFFKKYPELCSGSYVSMDDSNHANVCRQSFAAFRRNFKLFKQELQLRMGSPTDSRCSSAFSEQESPSPNNFKDAKSRKRAALIFSEPGFSNHQ
jgi:hypothetical protein